MTIMYIFSKSIVPTYLQEYRNNKNNVPKIKIEYAIVIRNEVLVYWYLL